MWIIKILIINICKVRLEMEYFLKVSILVMRKYKCRECTLSWEMLLVLVDNQLFKQRNVLLSFVLIQGISTFLSRKVKLDIGIVKEKFFSLQIH